MRVARIRPALVFKRDAASEIRRIFLGELVRPALVRRGLIPVVPAAQRLVFQAVHSLDAGQAFALAATRPVSGAFNVAADPVLDPSELARALGARELPSTPARCALWPRPRSGCGCSPRIRAGWIWARACR